MPKAQLIIEMNQKGQVNIQGPLENRALCYMLLGTAREILHRRAVVEKYDIEERSGPRLVGPEDLPPGFSPA